VGVAWSATAFVALLAACAALLFAPPADAAWPGRNGKIVFNKQGVGPQYVNPDGTGLAEAPAVGTWSPDGKKLVFACSDNYPSGGVCTINADGSSRTFVEVANRITRPRWSADQSKFIAVSGGGCFAYGCDPRYIVIFNQDGSRAGGIVGPWDDAYPAWSPDGTKIAFASTRDSPYPDTCGWYHREVETPCTWDIYIANADGSGQTRITNTPDGNEVEPDWSPDGSKLAFTSGSEIFTMNANGTNVSQLTNGGRNEQPAWSPDGRKIAFRTFRDEPDPATCSGQPDSHPCNFEIYTMNADGTGQTNLTNGPEWDELPDWQPLPPDTGYARPKAATPVNIAFVPAFNQCNAPSPTGSTHGAPLAVPSCQPGQQSSLFLTMGTGESNGQASQFEGHLGIKVICNPPAPNTQPPCTTAGDQADLALDAQISDVRTVPDLTDYLGELQVRLTLRMTDRTNGLSGTDPATAFDVPFHFAVPCTGTADTTIGSTCAVSTTADAVIPGIVPEGKRSVWELGQVQVYDGGADGIAATSDNTLYLTQGLFAP
jgi:TolB protein